MTRYAKLLLGFLCLFGTLNANEIIRSHKPDGTLITFTYTASGLLEEYSTSDGSINYHFIYDENGRLIKIEDKILQTETRREYDSSGQIVSETLGNGLTLANTYDSANNRTRLHLPDGSAIMYTYDQHYLRCIARLSKDGQIYAHHHYTQYSPQGDIVKMSLTGSAGPLTLNYDDLRRCRSIHSTKWSEEIPDDAIDSTGNIIALHFNDAGGKWEPKYTYDTMNRIASEDGDIPHSYAYDEQYNRILDNNVSLIINSMDQLIAAGDDAVYEYDLNGNVVLKNLNGEITVYRYDALNRLVEAERLNKWIIKYTYDAMQRRLSKNVSIWSNTSNQWELSQNLRYIYDGEKEIGAADDSGNIIELRVLGTGTLGSKEYAEVGAAVAIELNGAVYAPIHDHRGNVCCLVDSETGNVAEFYRYSAFGNTMTFSSQGERIESSLILNPWQFSSKRLDPETGLVYYGNRYYDPQTARWITKDPLGDYDGPNQYIFLHQAPLETIDLFGLLTWNSAWQSAKSWVSTSSSFLTSLKKQLSYVDHMQEEWNKVSHDIFTGGFLHLSGYYLDSVETGCSSFGEEISSKVRVTLINGILNARRDLERALKLFSSTHGNTVIHYVFHATEGWSKDICTSILTKFGYVSPYAKLLAQKWKELIQEMGGTDAGGNIIHYAHSIGATDTFLAKNLLSPEERRMIHVISIGSPSMIPDNTGFASTVNYVSRRDGVCLLDPVGYVNGLTNKDSNVEFLGTFWGVPLIDHVLYTDSYNKVIKQLGTEFVEKYAE